jgi:general secretion pathway protein A
MIYKELGLKAQTDDVVGMLNDLYEILMGEYKQGDIVLLIIDEAQNMPIETLENIRMLSNLETSKDKLVQIVLVGQPEFEKILRLHELRQLKQRIAIHSTIIPFTKKESMTYIKHRLAKAAANESPVFTQSALKRIVKEAAGIPRNLNILCDNALITGFGYKKNPVDAKIVGEVIDDRRGGEKTPFWKSSLPRWVFASFMVLILAVGLLLLSPYKIIFAPKAKSVALSRTVTISPAKEEMKLSAPPLPATQEKIEPLKEEKILEPVKQPFPLTLVPKKGDNLYRLTRKVYGYADGKLVAWVKQHNPTIKDINRIPVGEKIVFPENPQKQVKDEVKEYLKR